MLDWDWEFERVSVTGVVGALVVVVEVLGGRSAEGAL